MFRNPDELKAYVIENYREITDSRIDESHWDLQCTSCKVTRGFQLIRRGESGTYTQYGSGEQHFSRDFHAPVTYIFKCPVCKTYKLWVALEMQLRHEDQKWHDHIFHLTSLPSEGIEEIDELPEEPESLRIAYRQAIRAMDANAHLAAAAMFRRALQIITREVLGAKRGNLAGELQQVVGKTYKGTTVTGNFASNGYVIKEAGNQGAHPDKDPDLLEFTQQDAEDLQNIFMEIVSELFIAPAAVQKSKAEFLARRKIAVKP